MRVTHVITRLIVGGAQENTLASVRGLQARPGLEVQLLTGPTTGPEGSLAAAAPAGSVEIVRSLVRPVAPWRDLRAALELTRRFRRTRPDVVHTHSGKAGILGRIAARRAGVPVVVHTIHGPSFGAFQGAVANAVFRSAERRAGRCTTHFVAVADAMIRQYMAAGIGEPARYTRVFSGFPLAPFLQARPDPALRARLGLTGSEFVVGTIARLFKLKGHDELLAAAAAVVARSPQARFLWVGDGAWRARLVAEAARRGLARHILFAGLVAPEAVPEYLALMDVVVHLSRREGLPRALPQAMAAGRPVIAYALDGAPEVCRDGETGFLLEPGDLDTLARRLLDLAADRDLGLRLGQRGRELATAWFPVERMIDALHELYVRLLATAAAPARS